VFALPPLTVSGDRVALGPLRSQLAGLYAQWEDDPELQALRRKPVRPHARVEGRQSELVERAHSAENEVHFTIYETIYDSKAPRPIGVASLVDLDLSHGTAELVIHLGERDTWSTGLGTEATRLVLDYAFHALGLVNVLARVVEGNGRALTSLERAGFRRIGVRRGAYKLGRDRHDDVLLDCTIDDHESGAVKSALDRAFAGKP
jgi:RimJ/RimL family protein N-acetyltransferase